MELLQIANALGIEQYPPALDGVYAAGDFCDPCDLGLLEDTEKRYGIFGQYYEAVRQAMQLLPLDKNRYAWAQVVSTYIATAPVALASKIPMPATDGTAAGDLLPMLILLTQIPRSVEIYRSKGFSEEEIRVFTEAYAKGISIVERSLGRPAVNQLYYWWLCLYAKASIFHCGKFQFELRQLPNEAMFLQDKQSGRLIPVMTAGRFHRNGQVLGSAGSTEEEGAYEAAVLETEDAWYGFPATGRGAEHQKRCFPKERFTCALRPGDTVLSMHIAVGADLSRESVDGALAQAVQIARRSYPQWNTGAIYCRSWLLDPVLAEVLGDGSKIARFAQKFACHPMKSAGRAGFGYVFPGCSCPEEELPENTRLQKGLKAHFLSGGQLYGCAGAMIIQEG